MPIIMQHSGSPGVIGAASAAAGFVAGQERRAKNAAEFAQQQQRLELAARAQQQQAYQFEANRFDRMNSLVSDEQRFLLGHAFQADRDDRLFNQSLQRDRLQNEQQFGYLDRQYGLMEQRDDSLFTRGRAEEAAARVNALERELAQTPFDQEGENVRRELQEKLNHIRRDQTLRPGAYLEAVSQWEQDVERSGIRNHVQPPPDPTELFGGFVKNPETGAVDWKDGTQFFTHPGGFAIYNNQGKQEVRPLNHKDLVEAWGPELAAKIAKIPVDMLPKRETAQVRPFVDQSGRFDSDAFAKLKDRLRTETVQKEDDQGYLVEVPKYGNEAELDRATYLRGYAGIEPRFRPVAMLEGIMQGDLTPGDVQEMGFGDRLTDAVKQAVMSGQLDPVQAQTLGFDVSVSDDGVGVRIRPEDQPPAASAAGLSEGPRIVPQQSMTAGQRIQQNRVAAQPLVAKMREEVQTLEAQPLARAALAAMPQQAAPVIAELKQLTEKYAQHLENTGVGLEMTHPEEYLRMKELTALLEKMASPESQLRPDRVPDVFLGGGP